MRTPVMIASCSVLGLFALGGLATALGAARTATAGDIVSGLGFLMAAVAVGSAAIVLAIYTRNDHGKATKVAGEPPKSAPDPAASEDVKQTS